MKNESFIIYICDSSKNNNISISMKNERKQNGNTCD